MNDDFLQTLVVGSQVYVEVSIPHYDNYLEPCVVTRITPTRIIVAKSEKGHEEFRFKSGETRESRGQYRGSNYLLPINEENTLKYKRYILNESVKMKMEKIQKVIKNIDTNKLNDNEKLEFHKYLSESEKYFQSLVR